MGIRHDGPGNADAKVPSDQGKAPNSDDLSGRLNLPEEVSSQQAAKILGCCKHTVLQYLEEGLLEWRNTAPPSSNRPVYRFTLRSVLELRLGYHRGRAQPPQPIKPNPPRNHSGPSSGFEPKHVRRKKRGFPHDDTRTDS